MKLRAYRVEDAAVTSPMRITHPESFLAGPALTLVADDDTPLASSGIVFHWAGSGEAWLLVRPEVLCRHRFTIYKTVRRVLRQWAKDYHLRRVQAVTVAHSAPAMRFLEHLGFQSEGVMRRFDPFGQDCIRYAWLPEEVAHE